MTPKTQSVCKHCGKPIDLMSNRVCAGTNRPHEPLSEPASTGEPGTGFYRSASLQESIAQDEVERAARPSEPSAPPSPEFVHVHETLCGPTGTKYVEVLPCAAPQTSAARGITDTYEEGDENPNNVRFTYPTPQPVSGIYVSETKPHKVDDARIAEIFNREPVSGDAPKVEEILRQIGKEIDTQEFHLPADFREKIRSLLRYFPPASQTPPPDIIETMDGIIAIQQVQAYLISEDGKSQKGYFSPGGWAYEQLTRIANRLKTLPATPASTARTDGWVSVANGLPDDDSDVYAAIAWTHSPGVRKYVIHDCSYYEGGTGSGQKIFADCEGEEFEAKDVDFWIYKYRLAEQLPVPQAEPPKEEKP